VSLAESASVTDPTEPPVVDSTVGDLLRSAAADAPGRTALVEGVAGDRRRRWTFAELLQRAEVTAAFLAARFAPGERVVLWAPSSPEWLMVEFGAALAGVVVVTANPALTREELRYLLAQSRASGIVAMRHHRAVEGVEVAQELGAELPELREVFCLDDLETLLEGVEATDRLPALVPDDPFMIQYTSGTTGFPKGVVLSHRNVVNTARQLVHRMQAPAGSVWVNPLPLFHVGGSVLNALGTLWLRATHCPVLFDPATVLELVEAERATVLPAVPTMLIHLLDHPDLARRDVSTLRQVLSGGTAVPAALVRRLDTELGLRCCVMWGLTECSSVATQTLVTDSPEDLAETAGPPLPHTEVAVIDPTTGERVPPGTVGELLVRGPGVMTGYFDNPDATAAALEPDGWLHSGDLGTLDERGYVRVTGRLKEMIIRGGENIYPREIEEHLYTHPRVAEAAVVGVPDDVWGEQVAAVIRPAAGPAPDADDLRDYLRTRLAAHKVPRIWRFVETMPLTPSGKIKKFELRGRLTETAP
jgi:fatty-acyl-CoA synthase